MKLIDYQERPIFEFEEAKEKDDDNFLTPENSPRH